MWRHSWRAGSEQGAPTGRWIGGCRGDMGNRDQGEKAVVIFVYFFKMIGWGLYSPAIT